MLAESVSSKLGRGGIHYGWVMVALAFLTAMCSTLTTSVPGLLIVPITEEFGWARADVSAAIAVMFVLFACVSPFAGALLLRYGLRGMVVASATLSVAGLVIVAMANARWHLLVGLGLFVGTAAGLIGLVLAATIASRWFVARRGLVVGIMTAAFAAGQLLFLPAAAWLSAKYGWRTALVPPMIGSSICAVLFLFFGRDWPSDIGLPPYGEKRVVRPPLASASNAVALSLKTLKEASAFPIFWILAFTFFICGLSSTGIIQQHFIPFCLDNNVSAVVAASYLAMMGVFNFIGTVTSGWLSDRFDNRLLLAIYYSFRGLSLIWLPFSDFSVVALTIWAIFFGLDFIATVPPTVRLTTQHFGAAEGPILFGWIFAAHQFGAAVAAYGSGVTRDTVLTYLPAFLAAGIACLIAASMFALVRSPRPIVV